MRVVLVHNRYRSAAPSGENRVVDQEAAALADLGHEVTRFERSSDEIERWPRAKQASLPARVVWSREAHRGLTAVLGEHRPDVVHVHNTFPLLSPAVLYACRDAAVPVVATIHNYKLACASGDFFRNGSVCHDCADGLPAPAVRHGCYRGSRVATAPVALAMSAHRRAWRSLVSAYVFISAAQRDLLTGLALPPDRVFVRHNLIPRRSAPAVAREPSVVYAGRLDEAKGLRLLMAGWDRYRATAGDTGLRLVIAGSGPLEREVAAWASARPSVQMVGQLASERCSELISRARAVLLPSAWEETFGLVAIEAMALGVPPIASGHGSFPELITPEVDGVLFQPGDPAALAQAVADAQAHPEQFWNYGEKARKTYEQRFDPQHSAERLLEIYRFAIAHPVLSKITRSAGDRDITHLGVNATPAPPPRPFRGMIDSLATHNPGGAYHRGHDMGKSKGILQREYKADHYKKDFWSKENLKFVSPHFRLEKAARIANRIAQGKECDLLDVGCGPATLGRLLSSNINYFGIDIAIPSPAPNLIEMDILEKPIGFEGRQFDIIMAQGVFEYLGRFQSQKLAEISGILRHNGKFVVSYVNFGHRNRELIEPYSNVQPLHDFRDSLAQYFTIERLFPASHNWHHGQPNRWFMKASQKHLALNIPFISPLLAVEYFFICSHRSSPRPRTQNGRQPPAI